MLRFTNPYKRMDILEAAIRRLAVRLAATEKRLKALDQMTAKRWGVTSETLKEGERLLNRETAAVLARLL